MSELTAAEKVNRTGEIARAAALMAGAEWSAIENEGVEGFFTLVHASNGARIVLRHALADNRGRAFPRSPNGVDGYARDLSEWLGPDADISFSFDASREIRIVAKNIVTRVITPYLKVYPLIVEKFAQEKAQWDRCYAAATELAKVLGAEVTDTPEKVVRSLKVHAPTFPDSPTGPRLEADFRYISQVVNLAITCTPDHAVLIATAIAAILAVQPATETPVDQKIPKGDVA